MPCACPTATSCAWPDEADDLWSSYTQALPWLLGGVLVVLALGALLAWWLTRRLGAAHHPHGRASG